MDDIGEKEREEQLQYAKTYGPGRCFKWCLFPLYVWLVVLLIRANIEYINLSAGNTKRSNSTCKFANLTDQSANFSLNEDRMALIFGFDKSEIVVYDVGCQNSEPSMKLSQAKQSCSKQLKKNTRFNIVNNMKYYRGFQIALLNEYGQVVNTSYVKKADQYWCARERNFAPQKGVRYRSSYLQYRAKGQYPHGLRKAVQWVNRSSIGTFRGVKELQF